MMKTISIGKVFAMAAGVALASTSGAAWARDLVVTDWGGPSHEAQVKIYYDPFMAETGIKIQNDLWSGGLGILRTKVSSGNPDWDVVQVEADEVLAGCDEGLFEPIDWEAIGGKDKFLPAAVNDCGVGSIVWGIGLGYDADRISDSPKSWADFWDMQKYPGKRAMRKTPRYTLEFALMADGVPVDQVYEVLATPEGVDRAFAKLDEIKSDIIWWTAGSQSTELLTSGEVALTVIYSSRIRDANEQKGKNLGFVWNGAMYNLDFWTILSGSPNVESATKFIAFATRSDIQKNFPSVYAHGVTNLEAIAQTDPGIADTLATYPDYMKNELKSDIVFWADNLEALTQRFNVWAGQ